MIPLDQVLLAVLLMKSASPVVSSLVFRMTQKDMTTLVGALNGSREECNGLVLDKLLRLIGTPERISVFFWEVMKSCSVVSAAFGLRNRPGEKMANLQTSSSARAVECTTAMRTQRILQPKTLEKNGLQREQIGTTLGQNQKDGHLKLSFRMCPRASNPELITPRNHRILPTNSVVTCEIFCSRGWQISLILRASFAPSR